MRGEVGELVCKRPWPGMTRGIWGDPERYMETYWSMYPDVWRHGDWALIDDDGDWFLLGRSDDTINVAGKRLGPAEVESVLVSHPAVAESAVVGVPDETKGEAIWCFCVVADGGGRRDGARSCASWSRASWAGRSSPRASCSCDGAAEDALGQDPAARGARGRGRRGPRRHVVAPRTRRRSTTSAPRWPEPLLLGGRARPPLGGHGLVDQAHQALERVGCPLDRSGIDVLRGVGGAMGVRDAAAVVRGT